MYPLEFSRMSLVTAIIGSDGIVLASDSMETAGEGDYQGNNAHKIERITGSVWMVCASNYAGYTNCLIDDFINDMRGRGPEGQKELDVRAISEHFETYANSKYMKLRQQGETRMYQHRPPRDQFCFIFGGYTNDVVPSPRIRIAGFTEGLPSFVPPFALQDYQFHHCGIEEIATYWMLKIERVRRLNTIDAKILKALTILIFIETIKATKFVGPPLDVVTIKPAGIPEKTTISEIDLEQIGKRMGVVIGEETILHKLARLEGDVP